MLYNIELVSAIHQQIICFLEWLPFILPNKESVCSAGDPGSIPGSGRFPGEGNGNPPQYCCLENPMDRGAWQATIHGVAVTESLENNPEEYGPVLRE